MKEIYRVSPLLVLVAFLVTPRLSCAEPIAAQYSVTAWGHKDGLPSTFIYSIAQTGHGFLWLGTDDGVIRFDAVQFAQWRPALPNGELSGQVRVLHVSPQGELLLGTGTGLVGSMRKDGVEAAQLDSAIESIQDGRDGSVWVGTNAALWHLAAGSLEPTEPPVQFACGMGVRLRSRAPTDASGSPLRADYSMSTRDAWWRPQRGVHGCSSLLVGIRYGSINRAMFICWSLAA
ncbi:MAG: two-component regulator propeller domain-containing protein [Acidobacteriaceae bacterium]